MPAPRLPERTRAGAGADAPPIHPAVASVVPPARSAHRRGRPARAALAASFVVVVGIGGLLAGPVAAQVDPEPEPTTTAAPTTTMAPTTVAPTTAAPTTAAPVTNPPTTFATTQRPVVTTAVPTTVQAVVAQASSTTTSAVSSTTSTTDGATTTTAGLLVDASETVDTEPVAETDGLSSTTKLRLIVGALIAIAVVVSVLTFIYWRKTRPYEWEEWEDADDVPAPTAAATTASAAVASSAAPAASPKPAESAEPIAPLAAAPPTAAGPVVPSLIDPDLRARVQGTSSAPSPGAAPSVAAGDTQALPIVTIADGAPEPAGQPAAPGATPVDDAAEATGTTRWGTARVQADPVPAPDGTDADAPFRPPTT
jgi:hypothetical protein